MYKSPDYPWFRAQIDWGKLLLILSVLTLKDWPQQWEKFIVGIGEVYHDLSGFGLATFSVDRQQVRKLRANDEDDDEKALFITCFWLSAPLFQDLVCPAWCCSQGAYPLMMVSLLCCTSTDSFWFCIFWDCSCHCSWASLSSSRSCSQSSSDPGLPCIHFSSSGGSGRGTASVTCSVTYNSHISRRWCGSR